MPPDNFMEDLDLAAENRRRRRMGLAVRGLERWPTEEFQNLQAQIFEVGLAHPDVTPQGIITETARLYLEDGVTVGVQARLMERAVALLAELRALVLRSNGTREPGEDDA